MVGHRVLVPAAGVRVPLSQPKIQTQLRPGSLTGFCCTPANFFKIKLFYDPCNIFEPLYCVLLPVMTPDFLGSNQTASPRERGHLKVAVRSVTTWFESLVALQPKALSRVLFIFVVNA